MVERPLRMREVGGSMPSVSMFFAGPAELYRLNVSGARCTAALD